MKKNNNYHIKISSDFISKSKLTKNTTPNNNLIKSNDICIKNNQISNKKEEIFNILNQNEINGRSFDKDSQEKNKMIKEIINSKKNVKNKESKNNSNEIESKDESSTNNLTENLNNNFDIRNSTNINIYKKIEKMNEFKQKNSQDDKNKNLNMNQNKKNPGYLNNNKSLNNYNVKKNKLNSDMANKTKRKLSNVIENIRSSIGISGLLPIKSKTQNYANYNIKNFGSNKKKSNNQKIFGVGVFNKSFENNKIKNNLHSSKKKLTIYNIYKKIDIIKKEKNNKKENKDKKTEKDKLKQKNAFMLTDTFPTKKTIKINLTKNKKINIIKYHKIKNLNEESNNNNNHTIKNEQEKMKVNWYSEKNDINKYKNDNKNLKKKKSFIKRKILRNNIYNNDKNGINTHGNKENKINLNKDNLFIIKKKINYNHNTSIINQNNLNDNDSKLEISLKKNNSNNPIINKVLIFEMCNAKTSKNSNNNNLSENKCNSLKYLNLKYIQNNNLFIQFTPQKNKIKYIIKNNIKLRNNKKTKNNFGEIIATPIKHTFAYFKHLKNNQNEIKEKEFCEMETPILLDIPKLTDRILDNKINLFEKIKNMQTNMDKNDIKKKDEEKSCEKNLEKKNIKDMLLLEEKCIANILFFLDIEKINILCTLNKKCFNIIKPIINAEIKEKILNYYLQIQNTTQVISSKNKIKLSLMSYSSLNKLSPILLHKKYVDLLLENNQKYDKEIQKDLTRTFPNNSSFNYGKENYNKLYHLLTVYSLFNQKIGYTQGINFLAANIIILMQKEKEEKSLMFLDGFIHRFNFEKLVGLGKDNLLNKNLNIIENYLKKHCTDIINFLEKSNLSHEIFTTNWMLTLFANSMETKYLFIVWDFLIIFGWKFFSCFIVSVLDLFKNEILNEEQNKLNFLMKNILRNQKFKDKFRFIINKTFLLLNNEYSKSQK